LEFEQFSYLQKFEIPTNFEFIQNFEFKHTLNLKIFNLNKYWYMHKIGKLNIGISQEKGLRKPTYKLNE
jgi:hypothetical protein